MIVQDRQESRPFRSQTEEEKLPLDNNSKKDLERHRPIVLLPDREATTVIAWLKAHPEIDIVSRDRGSRVRASREKRRSTRTTGRRSLACARAPYRRVLDFFRRKERLRAKDL
jgi:hypothetical protein